ncbi:hypothetical protein KVR01_001003 [Diaporthe batatas]|uniref:uncharacterized protein n=1 Tax=Diaporthe batatas TaxID=748121 RepID=UPI001D05701E|nr:uncharacterized protein KVR01_001003 [Diaporthe batatas]KAG8170258.1 hypothetical protein KVR01_001003 [Diaporthe batatas]
MRLVICAASRLSRPGIGQAFTAAPPATLRYSSNASAGNTDSISAEITSAESTTAESTTADEFVKQVIGTPAVLATGNSKGKKSSSNVAKEANPQNVFRVVAEPPRSIRKQAEGPSSGAVRKVQMKKIFRKVMLDDKEPENPSSIVDKPLPMQSNDTKTASPLIRKAPVHGTQPWRLPSKLWPEKPAAVISRRGLLILRGLPLETTLRDIILAIDHAARNRQVSRLEALVADIAIKTSVDKSTEVDAVVEFKHPDSAMRFRGLVSKGEFRVRGVLPTGPASFYNPKDPSKLPQAFEGDGIIARLSKVDRAEYFTSPEQRKIVRRTHLIYN